MCHSYGIWNTSHLAVRQLISLITLSKQKLCCNTFSPVAVTADAALQHCWTELWVAHHQLMHQSTQQHNITVSLQLTRRDNELTTNVSGAE